MARNVRYSGKRTKMPRKRSRKVFSRTSGAHRKNIRARPMRGGIRL